ncbi:MAG: Ppx/GppA family phosphatase [Pseudomonadota bacterium]
MEDLRGVVDIGSNSVRLVVYTGPNRAPVPICNEKTLCALGRDLDATGAIDDEAMACAIATLRRFQAVLTAMGGAKVRAVATAAVREASNGADFVSAARTLGFDVEVLSGAEEARQAALGVLAAEPSAKGVVGDLGGGSLELIDIDGTAGDLESKLGARESLSVGPLRLIGESGGDRKKAQGIVEKRLEAVDWLTSGPARTLYVVGGAWRALARIHMASKGYPLSVLHHYEMSDEEALSIADWVGAVKDPRTLENIPGVPRRRIDMLPYAALTLEMLIRMGRIENIVISSTGLREGLLYEQLSPAEQAEDPLIAAADEWARRLSPNPAFGCAAERFTEALFPGESMAEKRLRKAACRMADIGALFHPDHRAAQAFATVLHAPFTALDHDGRIFLSYALFRRYAGRSATAPTPQVVALLDNRTRRAAERLGLALRFAGEFAPKASDSLGVCTWGLKEGVLTFRAPVRFEPLFSETVKKRLGAVADAFDATLDLQVSG